MAIPYLDIAKAVALRANQLPGGDASVRAQGYGVSTMSVLNTTLDGVDVPYNALKETILAQEAALVAMIANSTNPLYRSMFLDRSVALVSPSDIPTISNAGVPFIGSFDGWFDSSDGTSLTEGDSREIDRFNENVGGFFVVPKFQFYIVGSRIYHTRPSIYARGCIYDHNASSAAYNTSGNSLLPQEFEDLFVMRVLGALAQEDWFVAEAGLALQLASKFEQELFEGKVAKLTMPTMPRTVSRVDPAAG